MDSERLTKRPAQIPKCIFGYLDIWAIAQTSKSAVGELRRCTNAQNSNHTIRQMRGSVFAELPACANRGFNRRELYGTMIEMIRFTFNFGMAL